MTDRVKSIRQKADMMIRDVAKYFIPISVLGAFKRRRDEERIMDWNRRGRPVPPPHIVKQRIIAEYRKKYKYEILVETGTYMGDMVEAQKKRFREIYSIELGLDLFNKAVRRFEGDNNIKIIHGDSGKVLPGILANIKEPAIFWLDGHYSAGITARGEKNCPIFEELYAILYNKEFDHVVLIDDARYFIGKGDYPTIDDLTSHVKSMNDKYRVVVECDTIRYVI